MITVFLMGGLGNQLFQIFAALAYAIQYNTKIILPYDEVLTTGKHRPTYWGNFLNSLTIFTTANPANGISNRDLFAGCTQYRWEEHHYKEIPYQGDQNILLYGYFQSPKYFEKHKGQIMRMMRIEPMKESLKEEYSSYYTSSSQSHIENVYTISMHFRLGDYKNNPAHPILSYEYYANALTLITGFIRPNIKIRVLYFCENEDHNTVKEMITRLQGHCHIDDFMKVGDEVADWKQMLLMSLCDSNIIANSSFSWWGAYFGGKKDRGIVCYPTTWFSGGLANNYMGDMFPEEWIAINN